MGAGNCVMGEKIIKLPHGLPARRSRAAKFRQTDVARALKAAQKAKAPVRALRINPDGAIEVVFGKPDDMPHVNDWDDES
jgi:hypothetical protein